MAELSELHIESHDTYGQRVGVIAAILAVFLSIFTICAHREHTASIELQNDSNDNWALYQAKHNRDYQLEMNMDLLKVIAPSNPSAAKLRSAYANKREEYTKELDTIKKEALDQTQKNVVSQKKALYFDFAEGVMEISLVMSSLYFISRKKLFPKLGLFFGLTGLVVGFLGMLI